MLRSMAGGLGLLLIVVGGFFLARAWDLIGGVMIGIYLLAAARYCDRGSEAMTELDEIRQAVRRLWADFPRLSSDAPVPRRVSPARGWTDEYGGVEYGGLPVKYVVLHQMNQGPPTARTFTLSPP
jgi:hypothetical protein